MQVNTAFSLHISETYKANEHPLYMSQKGPQMGPFSVWRRTLPGIALGYVPAPGRLGGLIRIGLRSHAMCAAPAISCQTTANPSPPVSLR